MRSETIGQRLDRILDRLTPPRAISKNVEAQAQEVQAMHKAISAACPKSGYEEWLDRFEERLFSDLKTRAWPTLNEVKRACHEKSSGSMNKGQEIDLAALWFQKTNRPHPALNDPMITSEMISRGLLSDIREARWRGFDLTTEQGREAREMRPGREEWNHHVSVMARLNDMTFQEAEARELRELSPGQLPLHRYQEAAE